MSTRLQAVVGSLTVPPESGEAVEALALIKALPLDGAVVTGDAAFTTARIVQPILDKGGHDFLWVKANQPELEVEIAQRSGPFQASSIGTGRMPPRSSG